MPVSVPLTAEAIDALDPSLSSEEQEAALARFFVAERSRADDQVNEAGRTFARSLHRDHRPLARRLVRRGLHLPRDVHAQLLLLLTVEDQEEMDRQYEALKAQLPPRAVEAVEAYMQLVRQLVEDEHAKPVIAFLTLVVAKALAECFASEPCDGRHPPPTQKYRPSPITAHGPPAPSSMTRRCRVAAATEVVQG